VPFPIFMTDKHELFCKALLKHKFNQTRAYMEVYPDSNENAARASASELLTNPSIKEYLEVLKAKQEINDLVEIEEIIGDIKEVLTRCMRKEPVMEYNKTTKEWESTGEWQFRDGGALKALELLGKYKAMFTDKIEHGGNVNVLTFEKVAAKDGDDT